MAAELSSESVCGEPRKTDRSRIPTPQTSSEAVQSAARARISKALKQVEARRVQLPPHDPDLAAVGSLIEGSKVYVLLAACVLCKALSVLLLKHNNSLDHLRAGVQDAMAHLGAPKLMVFCHQAALVGIFCLLKWLGMVNVPRISMPQLWTAGPHAVLESLEMVFFFSSLHKGSLLLVVTFTSVASAALRPLASRFAVWGRSLDSTLGSPCNPRQLTALFVATGGTTIEFLTHPRPTAATATFTMLWVAVRALHSVWQALQDAPLTLVDAREHATSGRIFNILPVAPLKRLLEPAHAPQPPPAARALMRHAIACLPVLALALILQEGAEVMRHEVSVPSVTSVVLSAVVFGVAEGVQATMRCGATAAAALDSAYLLTLATIVTLGSPGVKSLARAAGLLLVAAALLVLRRTTAEGPLLPHTVPAPA